MKRFIAYALLSFFVLPSEAYIYHALVMRKWNEQLNRYHYFIGLGDFHHKQHPANQKHLQELQNLLAEAPKNSLKVLTEDLSVANDIGRRGSLGFSINSRGGLLGGLTDICRDIGIPTKNLEYRYARVCALGPMLNNLKADPYSFDSTRMLSVGDLADEIYTELARVAQFKDGMPVQSWYNSCMRDIQKRMESFNWSHDKKMSVAEYLSQTKKPLGPFLQNLLTFDAGLLDIKIVHEIMQHPDVDYTCAIAGGSHIDRAGNALKKIGYASIWHAQSEGAVASAIDAGSEAHRAAYITKPAPISFRGIKKFFHTKNAQEPLDCGGIKSF